MYHFDTATSDTATRESADSGRADRRDWKAPAHLPSLGPLERSTAGRSDAEGIRYELKPAFSPYTAEKPRSHWRLTGHRIASMLWEVAQPRS